MIKFNKILFFNKNPLEERASGPYSDDQELFDEISLKAITNNSKSGLANADIDMPSISQNIQIQIPKFSDSELNSNALLNQETAKVNLFSN